MVREHGQTKLITTREKFPEYFGIPETEPERIRTFLAENLGIKVGPKKDKVPPPELAEADGPGAPGDGALAGEAGASGATSPSEESTPPEPVAPAA